MGVGGLDGKVKEDDVRRTGIEKVLDHRVGGEYLTNGCLPSSREPRW